MARIFVADLSFLRFGWLVKIEPSTTIAGTNVIYYKPITNPFKVEKIELVKDKDYFYQGKAELENKASFERNLIVLRSESVSPFMDKLNRMFSELLKQRSELEEKATIQEALRKETEFWAHTETLGKLDELAKLQEMMRKKGLLKREVVKRF